MVASVIVSQPGTSGIAIKAAYRRLYFTVRASVAYDPTLPMYADIYIGASGSEVYYKTISVYSIANQPFHSPASALYEFDIQDALQEYLDTYIPFIPMNTFQSSNPFPSNSFVSVYVKFRGSSISGGLLIPEPTVPIQGTATSSPVAGTGLTSNDFLVYLASLLANFENNILFNDLEAALTAMQITKGAVVPLTIPTGTRIYPLSSFPLSPITGSDMSRPDPNVALTNYALDNGGFPLTVVQYATSGILSTSARNCKMFVTVFNQSSLSSTRYILTPSTFLVSVGTYYIPIGIPELTTLLAVNYTAPGAATIIAGLMNPNNDAYYQVELFDNDSSNSVFFTPWYKGRTTAIERKRIAFQNTYGHFEFISFVRNSLSFKASSSEQFVPYTSLLPNPISNLAMGHKRMSIKAADEYTLTAAFTETEMPWLRELIMSANIFIQVDGASPVLRPMKMADGAIDVRKTVMDNRINYIVTIKLPSAIDYITLRN